MLQNDRAVRAACAEFEARQVAFLAGYFEAKSFIEKANGLFDLAYGENSAGETAHRGIGFDLVRVPADAVVAFGLNGLEL